MQIERPLQNEIRTQRLGEMESCIEALNARIARLAIALGVPLEVGAFATRQILISAEALMVRKGFEPDADGIELDPPLPK
jgi:hypothetical protein